jgi:CRISPR-associated protein Csb2
MSQKTFGEWFKKATGLAGPFPYQERLATSVRPDLVVSGLPEVTPVWDDNHVFKVAGRWRTIQFKRFRRKRGDDGGRRLAGAFRLTFPDPVRGPIALGWSSHFGMGLFLPVEEGGK